MLAFCRIFVLLGGAFCGVFEIFVLLGGIFCGVFYFVALIIGPIGTWTDTAVYCFAIALGYCLYEFLEDRRYAAITLERRKQSPQDCSNGEPAGIGERQHLVTWRYAPRRMEIE